MPRGCGRRVDGTGIDGPGSGFGIPPNGARTSRGLTPPPNFVGFCYCFGLAGRYKYLLTCGSRNTKWHQPGQH